MAAADVIRVCDFCLAPHPQWAFPLLERASTRMFHPGLGIEIVTEDTDAWWGACAACADLIRNRQIGQLRNRSLAVLKARLPAVSYQEMAWAKESVLLQLAAFWQASPGSPVEVSVLAD